MCKVAVIIEELCGTSVSSTQASKKAAKLDEILEAWHTPPLGEIIYLLLDARYEKVRQDGQIWIAAVLTTVGVDPQSRRRILDVLVSLSEAESIDSPS